MATKKYDLISKNNESTVVREYSSPYKREKHYQSEDALEKAFIKQLEAQSYEYLNLTSEEDLIRNLKKQIEKLNNYEFTDGEWDHFFKTEIANPNSNIASKTEIIQESPTRLLSQDNGEKKNIRLIDKKNVHNNFLQVINQYEAEKGKRKNRYDVTILVNGLPLIHVELKRRGVILQEAFNQINRYQRESFWESNGLFEYVQLFVISNGTYTKYYSNTTRFKHTSEKEKTKGKKSSDSFEFTNWWADFSNKPLSDLMDFSRTFFAKHTILNVLTKYCVFTFDKQLLVMRPYQIAATEKIIDKINISSNYKKYGSVESGGYIWHITGSGKTLTSFKTAQLATKISNIKKVLFVVDRKDLDYQTMKEYDKFEKGAANSNTNTSELKKQLSNPDSKIVITTIQKLDRFIKKNKGHKIFDGEVVLIFDECHRSQFGDMHTSIIKAFNKYYLFGFTGTPIFSKNSSSGGKINLKTTEQAFGKKLHTYTIVNAIGDGNVLPFKLDYISTIKEKEQIDDKKVVDINREKALMADERISRIVKYILDNFDSKTKRNEHYNLKGKPANGFNSIFAVSSIPMAKKYYLEFKRQIEDLPSDKKLKVGTIFSYAPNEEEVDGMYDENSDSTTGLDKNSRDFLEGAIKDYNKMFGVSYSTSAKNFPNYYKNISERVKDRELDVLIVVNMFLTGFDATTLNTLWVDKNLRMHGLLQAYSRTNRILNSVKSFGNIVCFRNLEKATNESISLFGDKNARGVVLLKSYEEYYHGYNSEGKKIKGYVELIGDLKETFIPGEIIVSEKQKKDFVKKYGAILKLQNILSVFDEFKGNDVLTQRDKQDYHSMYLSIYEEFRKSKSNEKENINDDLVFEMELIKQVDINIDHILDLIKKCHKDNIKDKEILAEINKTIDSSLQLRNKRELIKEFIKTLDSKTELEKGWIEFVKRKKIEQLEKIIEEERLNLENTKKFIDDAFKEGQMYTSGTSLLDILPPTNPFSKDGERIRKKESVIEKLTEFFNRFYDISSGL
ncbi:type I restriction endonuclease subunit R [archaeon]|nr:type I restriction endonuclease subunit R [archaeon]